jgi:hypothetical protein
MHVKKTMLRVVEIALETKKLIFYNFVPSTPFLFLFFYFVKAIAKFITSTPTSMGFFFNVAGQNIMN